MLVFGTNLETSAHLVAGIVNCTPDSFAVHCARLDEQGILALAEPMVENGVDILEVGGCSMRLGAEPVSEQEEWSRVETALRVLRKRFGDIPLSIDTFRAGIARRAIGQFGVVMVNDVSGMADPEMTHVLAESHTPYVLVHSREACVSWDGHTDVVSELIRFFAFRLDELHRAGVADVILDPGFGFGTTRKQEYAILSHLHLLHILNTPIMVGLSRKRMVYEPLGITPQDALNGTTVLHVMALEQGADILRVHDVKAAREAIRLVEAVEQTKQHK